MIGIVRNRTTLGMMTYGRIRLDANRRKTSGAKRDKRGREPTVTNMRTGTNDTGGGKHRHTTELATTYGAV